MTEPVMGETAPAKQPGLIRTVWLYPAGFLLLLASVSIATSIGSVPIPLAVVWGIIADKLFPGIVDQGWSAGQETIIWNIRLPRAILACLVGGGLAIVGASLQAVTRNPLADPHLLGISSGGAFGAVLALLHTGLFLGMFTVPFLSFLGALASTTIVLVVAKLAAATTAARMVLAGVAVSFAVMSCASLLVFLGDPRAAHTVVYWMLGGLGLAQWAHVPLPFIGFALCLAFFIVSSGELNAVTLGDETASTLGIPIERFRLSVFVAGALLTGIMVAYSGIIGFVGLMMPHVARMLVGGDNVRVVPVAALAGAVFLVMSDIVARSIAAPEDMPIGIVTGLVGGLFFIVLLYRRRF